jgi:hypothetical protein
MVGRPDLASNYASMLASPVVGMSGQIPISGPGAGMISGSLTNTISGNVATGQMSLAMAAGLVVLMILLYLWTHGQQH